MRGCNAVGTSVPRRLWSSLGIVVGSMLATVSLLAQESTQTDPYTYYGGEIDREPKNSAVEACEYRVLVEEQRCNNRVNKTTCIKEVHSECREEFGDVTPKEPKKED